MSTTLKKSLFTLVLLLVGNSLCARVTPKDEVVKKAPTKIFFVKEEDKKRTPLAFSTKHKVTVGRARKPILKAFRSLTKTPLKLLTEKELRCAADLAISLGWHEDAIRYLARLSTETKSTKVVKNLKLELADIHFDRGALKVCAEGYQEFLKLYPGDKQAEYAQYKGLLSNFYAMLESDRDQTPTHNTIRLANSFLEKSEVYKQYNDDVRSILKTCHYALYDHEVVVFEYYMKKGSYKAAGTRLAAIKKGYQKKLPSTEPLNLHLEYRLASAQNKTAEAEKVHYKLASRFPKYSLKLANNNKLGSKKNYVSFF